MALPGAVAARRVARPVLAGELFDGRGPRLVGGWRAQYRPVTGAAYKTDLGAWVTWAVARGLTLATAGLGDIGAWVRTPEAGGTRPAGIARKLAALSSFYTWGRRRGRHRGRPVLISVPEGGIQFRFGFDVSLV
jgi:hypothetical protein